MVARVSRFWRDESGQALTEYGLFLAAIVVIVIVSMAVISGSIMDLFANMAAYIGGNASPST